MDSLSFVFVSIFLAGATDRKIHAIISIGSVSDSIAKGLLYILIAVVLLLLLIGLNRWKAIKPRRRKK